MLPRVYDPGKAGADDHTPPAGDPDDNPPTFGRLGTYFRLLELNDPTGLSAGPQHPRPRLRPWTVPLSVYGAEGGNRGN